MKKFLLICSLFSLYTHSFSQDCPIVQDQEAIKQYQLESVSIFFNSITDLQKYDSLEVTRVEFDREGKIVYEKYFYLFDVMFYSHEFQYNYNESGQLVEKIETSQDYPQTKRDSSLLNFEDFGPRITREVYEYDDRGRLMKEFIYSRMEDEKPSQSIFYEYDKKGNKVKGTFTLISSPEEVHSFNRVEEYKYNKMGKRIKTKMKGINSDTGYLEKITYNSLGDIIEESIIYKANYKDRSGTIRKYSYQGNLLSYMERYQVKKNKSKLYSTTIYEYTGTGCKTKETRKYTHSSKDWVSTFVCNEMGLLRSEYWYNQQGEKAFSFETEYQFYQ